MIRQFKPNHGEGLSAFHESDLTVQDLTRFDGPDMLRKIALDLDCDLKMRNEALNGLRVCGAKDFKELTVSIATSTAFEDNYRAYAVQHLNLACHAESGLTEKDLWINFLLDPLLKPDLPLSVRREAAYGPCEITTTRDHGFAWLESQVKSGHQQEFGDLYLRVCDEFSRQPDSVAITAIKSTK